jgi:hypothetical protein
MSETIKLFSQSQRTAGQSMTIPIVGTVTFDKDQNYIEVVEEKVAELKSKQFGVILLTAEEVASKKEIADKTKRELKVKKSITKETVDSLSICFENLKEGRSQEEQDYLSTLIVDLNAIGIEKKSDDLNKAEKMLRSLDQKDLRELLEAYPKKETKTLNNLEKVIAYLKIKLS